MTLSRTPWLRGVRVRPNSSFLPLANAWGIQSVGAGLRECCCRSADVRASGSTLRVPDGHFMLQLGRGYATMIATRVTRGTLQCGPLRRTLSSQPPGSGHRSRSGRASMVFFGVPIAITTVLGIWQVRRLDEKRTQISLRTERLNMGPLDGIPEDAALAESQYCRVRATGRCRGTPR